MGTAVETDAIPHFAIPQDRRDDNIQVQECASDGQPADDVSVDSVSINTPFPPTFPDDSFPTTQDSFIVTGGASQDDDNSGVGDDNESIVCQSQLLTDNVVMAQSCSTITYAMLKQVASELVEVAVKQNDSSNKVSACGMMLRATNLLRGNGSLASAGLMKPLSSIFISFLHVFPTSFLVRVFEIMRKLCSMPWMSNN
jgi:hypothetical protein